jgi:hypothetical protein
MITTALMALALVAFGAFSYAREQKGEFDRFIAALIGVAATIALVLICLHPAYW